MPFRKKENKEKHSFSPGAHGTVYLLGALYLTYLLVTFLQEAYKGGEDAPSLPLLIVGILVLGGGVLFLAWMAWKMSRVQPESAEEEELPEADREEEELLENEADNEFWGEEAEEETKTDNEDQEK